MKNKRNEKQDAKINRKEALKKAGKYAAFTAVAAVILLSPVQAQTTSRQPTQRGRGL